MTRFRSTLSPPISPGCAWAGLSACVAVWLTAFILIVIALVGR